MSSPQSLWAPKAERPVVVTRDNMVSGTWLQLSPTTSAPITQESQTIPVGATLPSPAIQADSAEITPEELNLTAENAKFLSNNASRSSSMSSTSTNGAFRHPPLGQRSHAISHVERREATMARGINLASLQN